MPCTAQPRIGSESITGKAQLLPWWPCYAGPPRRSRRHDDDDALDGPAFDPACQEAVSERVWSLN